MPADFIVPAQPTLAEKAPSGPGWTHELKHDGYRLIARKDGARVRLWTRQGNDFTAHFPLIAAAVANLPIGSVILDGEAIVHRPDGHSDFDALRSKEGGKRAIMIAFDAISIAGTDLRKEPLEKRRARLEVLLGCAPNGLMFSQSIDGDGPVIFEHACRLGAEGIISKRLGSPYRSGRVDSWRKTKFAGYERRS